MGKTVNDSADHSVSSFSGLRARLVSNKVVIISEELKARRTCKQRLTSPSISGVRVLG